MQIQIKQIYIIALLLSFIFIPHFAFSYSIGNTFVFYGGAADSLRSANYSSQIIIGEPFIGASEYASGNLETDLGQWSFYFRQPDYPMVSASDGEFSTYVEITWNQDPLDPPATGVSKIYRDEQYIDDVDEDIDYYNDDYNVNPGNYYEYGVQLSNAYGFGEPGTDTGFIKPNGIITGNIRTPNNNGVPNVLVTLDPSIGYAVQLEEADTLTVSVPNSTVSFSDKFTLETWLKTTDTSGSILQKGNFEIKLDAGKINLEVNQADLLTSNYSVNNNEWHHLALVSDSTNCFLYVNGLRDTTGIACNNSDDSEEYIFGKNFTGSLDDVRIWDCANDSTTIQLNKDRVLTQNTLGLVAYWPMNENLGTTAFDGSVNSNHLQIFDETLWTNNDAPVILGGLSDINGDYVIESIPYENAGTTYSASPYKYGHVFQPEQRLVTISGSNISADDVNFTDNSLITISGTVTYHNTNCKIQGVQILDEDGEDFYPPIRTDENGEFRGDFEHSGSYILTAHYEGHEFTTNVQPDYYSFPNLTSPQAGINFYDMKTDTLFVDVKGGPENQYPIGSFTVKCETTNRDFGIKIEKDTETASAISDIPLSPIELDSLEIDKKWDNEGRLILENLPPLVYNVSIDYLGNSTPSELVTLSDNPFETQEVSLVDSANTVTFNWRAPMHVEIIASSEMGSEKSFADYPNSTFYVVEQNEWYNLELQTYENYSTNTHPEQKYYLSSGEYSFVDDISQREIDPITFSGLEIVEYDISPFIPNAQSGYERQYQNKLEVTMYDEELERYASQSLWVLIEGEVPRQSSYATTSPALPILILHDPPGDGSYSSFNQSSSHSLNISLGVRTSLEQEFSETLSLGHTYETEAGTPFFSVGTKVETEYEVSSSITMGVSQAVSTEQTWEFTTTEEFTTSSDDQIIGEDADLFVGSAINFLFSKCLLIDWCDSLSSVVIDTTMMTTPEGFETTYIYTKNQIVNTVLPNLEALAVYYGDESNPDYSEELAEKYEVSYTAWDNILEKNQFNMENAEINENHPANISFNAGAGYYYSEENNQSSSLSMEWEVSLSTEFAESIGLTIDDFGAGAGYRMMVEMNLGAGIQSTSTSSTSISYVLADDDETSALNDLADHFTVDIKKDPVYGTPVFNLVSGRSSCPWEPNTTPRDVVTLIAPDSSAYTGNQGLPIGTIPAIALLLGNNSHSEEDRQYWLSVLQHTNPTGATVKINGITLEGSIPFNIPYNNAVSAIMTVEKGPGGNVIDSLGIRLSSPCDGGEIGAEYPGEYFSVDRYFKISWDPPYSEVVIHSPQENWVLNKANDDTLMVTLRGYNTSISSFGGLKLQYNFPGGDMADWKPCIDTEIPISILEDSPNYYEIPWDVSGISDGTFYLRAVAVDSFYTDFTTEYVTGTIDRKLPEVMGLPSPNDGVLDEGDEICLYYDEVISADRLDLCGIEMINTRTGAGELNYDIQAFDNKLIITPTDGNQYIENEILRVSLEKMYDLHNNCIEYGEDNPLVWEFYVNRNPINWNITEMDVIKPIGEEMILTANLSNESGYGRKYVFTDSAQFYYHEDLQYHAPVWLTVSPSGDSLAALDTQEISFIISDQIGFGHYETTIYAHTAMGNEGILIKVDVLSNPPDWSLNEFTNYQSTMNIVGELVIDGAISDDSNDIVGAFVEDENGNWDCRGVANIESVPYIPTHPDQIFLTIYGNDEDLIRGAGDIHFRIWDHSANKEYCGIDQASAFGGQLVYQPSYISGSPMNPVLMQTTNELIQSISLEPGWKWFSSNLEMVPNTINEVLSSLQPTNDDVIKDQSCFSQFYEGFWFGELITLKTTSMYKINVENSQELNLIGNLSNPDDTEIIYQNGWTWISFIPHVSMGINQALNNRINITGDFIKNQNEYAFYVDETVGWIGSLRFMNPGDGYMLYSNMSGSFNYPGNENRLNKSNYPKYESIVLRNTPDWNLNPQDYEYTASVTIELTENDVPIQTGNHIVGIFADDECRGTATATPVFDRFLYFLTAYSNTSNEILSFQIYSENQDACTESDSTFQFVNNLILGSPANPYYLDIGETLPAPQNVTISRLFDSVELNWDPVDGATVYIIYSSDSPDGVFIEEPNGYVQGTNWISFVQGSKRFYRVKACNNLSKKMINFKSKK